MISRTTGEEYHDGSTHFPADLDLGIQKTGDGLSCTTKWPVIGNEERESVVIRPNTHAFTSSVDTAVTPNQDIVAVYNGGRMHSNAMI